MMTKWKRLCYFNRCIGYMVDVFMIWHTPWLCYTCIGIYIRVYGCLYGELYSVISEIILWVCQWPYDGCASD